MFFLSLISGTLGAGEYLQGKVNFFPGVDLKDSPFAWYVNKKGVLHGLYTYKY